MVSIIDGTRQINNKVTKPLVKIWQPKWISVQVHILQQNLLFA